MCQPDKCNTNMSITQGSVPYHSSQPVRLLQSVRHVIDTTQDKLTTGSAWHESWRCLCAQYAATVAGTDRSQDKVDKPPVRVHVQTTQRFFGTKAAGCLTIIYLYNTGGASQTATETSASILQSGKLEAEAPKKQATLSERCPS